MLHKHALQQSIIAIDIEHSLVKLSLQEFIRFSIHKYFVQEFVTKQNVVNDYIQHAVTGLSLHGLSLH